MSSKPLYLEVTPRNWDEAKKVAKSLRVSIFRGHAEKDWPLSTTIERVAEQFTCPTEELWRQEKEVLRLFKSRAHHYIQSPPGDDDWIEWLSQIQHYGGPTRLLDFTDSFYLASFFALETAKNDACVWAINWYILQQNQNRFIANDIHKQSPFFQDSISNFAKTFLEDENKRQNLVLHITPPRLNERLAVQKGSFLFPCDIGNTFVSNLCATFGFEFSNLHTDNAIQVDIEKGTALPSRAEIVKINLPKENFLHLDAIKDLHLMNIDAASLYPGLDGFARSLKYVVRKKEKV